MRGGIQFLDGARLLSLHEMRQAVQDRHGPLTTARAFAALAGGGGDGGRSDGGSQGPAGPSGSGCASGSSGDSDQSRNALPTEPPEVLLPFTNELRGRKVYCLDLEGRVWLASGFNTLLSAPSLSCLLRRILT